MSCGYRRCGFGYPRFGGVGFGVGIGIGAGIGFFRGGGYGGCRRCGPFYGGRGGYGRGYSPFYW